MEENYKNTYDNNSDFSIILEEYNVQIVICNS